MKHDNKQRKANNIYLVFLTRILVKTNKQNKTDVISGPKNHKKQTRLILFNCTHQLFLFSTPQLNSKNPIILRFNDCSNIKQHWINIQGPLDFTISQTKQINNWINNKQTNNRFFTIQQQKQTNNPLLCNHNKTKTCCCTFAIRNYYNHYYFTLIGLPEFGREVDPEESSTAPLLLRVTPMHPPIVSIAICTTFHHSHNNCETALLTRYTDNRGGVRKTMPLYYHLHHMCVHANK